MEPEAWRLIERYGYNETVLNPYAFLFVILMAILLLFLPRRFAILPMVATACYITNMQRIVIAGLDFDMIRILVIIGVLRIFFRSEYYLLKLNIIDKTIICFVIISITTYTMLWETGGALINRIGWAYNIIGIYFIARIFIDDFDDIDRLIGSLIFFSIPIALSMVYEQTSGINPFSTFGGVPEFTMIRDGRFRSQGAFSHPILAGSFGASLLPLTFGYWIRKRSRIIFFIIGIVTSTVITITSASSGPFLAYLSGVMMLILWFFKKYMQSILWGILIGLIGLQLAMNSPIYALITRLGVVSGSTSDHRYRLIDSTIRNFNEWWLLGTKYTGHWGWGMQDVTNFYIRIAIDGGLLSLILFIAIIILCFRTLWLKVFKTENKLSIQKYVWAIGASFFTHIVSFYGVSYFGQIIFFWYMTLAIISTISVMDLKIN